MSIDNVYFRLVPLYRAADRLLFDTLSGMVLISLALAPWYPTWNEAAVFVVVKTSLFVWMSIQMRREIEAMGGRPPELGRGLAVTRKRQTDSGH